MKNSVRRASGALLLLLVGGCSGTSLSPAPTGNREIANTSGGAFTANSSGAYNFSDCNTSKGHFKFAGDGRASYLHRVVESGKLKAKRFGSRCVWSGRATLTSRHRAQDSVTFSLGLNGSQYHNPCNNALGYVVKRGTGRFANASGYGTVTFTCTSGGYVDQWSGTLNF